MIAALHIDWLRAAADIVGAFCCAWLGQEWGYRKGRKEADAEWDAWFGYGADPEQRFPPPKDLTVYAERPSAPVVTPPRESERLP